MYVNEIKEEKEQKKVGGWVYIMWMWEIELSGSVGLAWLTPNDWERMTKEKKKT